MYANVLASDQVWLTPPTGGKPLKRTDGKTINVELVRNLTVWLLLFAFIVLI